MNPQLIIRLSDDTAEWSRGLLKDYLIHSWMKSETSDSWYISVSPSMCLKDWFHMHRTVCYSRTSIVCTSCSCNVRPGAHLQANGSREPGEASSSSGPSCPIYLLGLQHDVTSVGRHISSQFSHIYWCSCSCLFRQEPQFEQTKRGS